jgi:hypothetical protein
METMCRDLDIEYVESTRIAGPYLRINPGVRTDGKSATREISIFTRTSKMRCASFGLPAGPHKATVRRSGQDKEFLLGGTCTQADRKDMFTTGNGRTKPGWICHGCYATSGNYEYRNVQLVLMVRREWSRRLLNKSAEAWAAWMTSALKIWFAKPRFTEKVTKKVTDGPDIKIPALPLSMNHFRIHDTGDIGWHRNYIKGWQIVASNFKRKKFWLPTRAWLAPNHLKQFAASPPNLIVRPSALWYDEPAPGAENSDISPLLLAQGSLSAGSSSAPLSGAVPDDVLARLMRLTANTRRRRLQPYFDRVLDDKGIADWDCPAYRSDDHDCKSAQCRHCWEMPHLAVNYTPHALGASMAAAVSKKGKKANPGKKLAVVSYKATYDNYDISRLYKSIVSRAKEKGGAVAFGPQFHAASAFNAEAGQVELSFNSMAARDEALARIRQLKGVSKAASMNPGGGMSSCGCGPRKANPRIPLAEAVMSYGSPRQMNPPDGGSPTLEAHLGRIGASPGDYSEAEWREVLSDLGMKNVDRQTDFMMGMAEW